MIATLVEAEIEEEKREDDILRERVQKEEKEEDEAQADINTLLAESTKKFAAVVVINFNEEVRRKLTRLTMVMTLRMEHDETRSLILGVLGAEIRE